MSVLIVSGIWLINSKMNGGKISGDRSADDRVVSRAVIHARVLRAILGAVPMNVGRRAALLDSEGLTAKDLLGVQAAIPLTSYMRLFDRLAEDQQNPALGLDLSLTMGPDLVGAIGYVFLHSATLDAALAAFAAAVFSIQGVTALQYQRLSQPVVRYVIADEALRPRRQDVEFSLGYVHVLVRRFLGAGYVPREVHFEHPHVGQRGHYERLFGCPVYFEQAQNALLFRAEDVSAEGRLHDPHLIGILQHYIELARPGGPMPDMLGEEVDALLPGMIEAGNASCRLVAARLGLTEETLRRRLRQEGASYRHLLRRRRCAIAARYLVETNLGILQVAQQAGYGETASFTRAFLAETGMTPSDFRRQRR